MPRTNDWSRFAGVAILSLGLLAATAGLAAGKGKSGGGQINHAGGQNFVRSSPTNQFFSQTYTTQGLHKQSTSFVPQSGQGPSFSGIGSTSNTFSRGTSRVPGTNTIGTFSGLGTNLNNNPQTGKFKKPQSLGSLGIPVGGTSTTIGTLPRGAKITLPNGGIGVPAGGTTSTIKSLPVGSTTYVPSSGLGTIANPVVSIKPSHTIASCLPPICPPHCPPHCPKFWPFPLPPICVITPPIVILPAPVTVVNRTVVVVARPVLVGQPIDLELVGLQLVDEGNRDEQIGPRYRVWVRNNGPALHTEFKVTILAANRDQPKPELPNVSGRVSTIEASQTIAVDLRLPLAAHELGHDAQGNAIPFSKLFVWIDSAQEIKESNEDNNATMMSRTEIPPVDAALAKAEEKLKP
jgi:hypothetical protein